MTPYQYIYLNLLTGEKKTRYLKFENDYWGGSIKELVEKSTLKKSEDILITSCGINKKLAKKYSDMWGSKWFMITNPTYGRWELSIYDQMPKSEDEAIQKRKETLNP